MSDQAAPALPNLPALPPLRVIFFTSLDADTANGVLDLFTALGQHVLLVVVTPGPPRRPQTNYRDVVARVRAGTDVLVTSHMGRLPALLAGLEPDLIFVAGFPWRLPPAVLALPRLGAINTHPALLPAYRGPDPIFHQIRNGEPQIGMTVHRMDPDFDTGPILAQGSMPLGPDDDADTVNARLGELGARVVPAGIAAAAAGEPGRPQGTAGASYAPLRTPADRVLDWSRPAADLHNQVRAWGSMGAQATLEGRRWTVRRSRVLPTAEAMALPGTVVARDADGLVVQTGAGRLHLVDAAPDATAAEVAV